MKRLIILLLIVGCEDKSTEPLVCDEGYTHQSDSTGVHYDVCTSICEIGETYNNGDCVCSVGYYDFSGICYYQDDLDFLQDLIELNEVNVGVLEMGDQKWNFGRLESLKLWNKPLTTLPESIGNLSSLVKLELWNNPLTSIPEGIGNLNSLETLDLAFNQLTSIPESIGNLSSLEYLNLSSNQFTTLPDSIGNLSSLEDLDLHNNQFTSIPEGIVNLSSLETLDLSYNQLTTLPEGICVLTTNCGINHCVNVSNNMLCEEYHYDCFNFIFIWGEQDQSNCP